MVTQKILKVCVVLVVTCAFSVVGQTRCRICNAARSLDDCTMSTTCGLGEKCYMDELVSETLSIEYYSGCRAKDVCISATRPVGKRSIAKRGSFIACSRCCDSSPTSDGRECNTKLCGIKYIYQMSRQCYLCDSTKPGGQGDVKDPTNCGSYTTCQTDEVCGSQTFALGMNVTHRMTCLPRRVQNVLQARYSMPALQKICTLLTHRALEDIKRCKDTANVAAGLCGSRKRSSQMVCTACCGDAVCNGGTCDDVLDRLYNLWTSNVLNFDSLKATGPLQHSTNVLKTASPTTRAFTSQFANTTPTLRTTLLLINSSSISMKSSSLAPTIASVKRTQPVQTVSTSTKGATAFTVPVQNQSSTLSVTTRTSILNSGPTLPTIHVNSTLLSTITSSGLGTLNTSTPTFMSNPNISILTNSLPSSSTPTTSDKSSLSAPATSVSSGPGTVFSSLTKSTPQQTHSTLIPILLLSSSTSTPRVVTTRVINASLPSNSQTTSIVKFTASPNSPAKLLTSSQTNGTTTIVRFTVAPITTSSVASLVTNTTPDSLGHKIRKPTGSEEIIPPTVLNLTPTSIYGNPPTSITTGARSSI